MPFNSFITVPTRSGSGYRVLNNYINNGRGRGIIVRGENGQIVSNSINYIAFDAITLVPGFDPTREGGFPKNVQARAPPLFAHAWVFIVTEAGMRYTWHRHGMVATSSTCFRLLQHWPCLHAIINEEPHSTTPSCGRQAALRMRMLLHRNCIWLTPSKTG